MESDVGDGSSHGHIFSDWHDERKMTLKTAAQNSSVETEIAALALSSPWMMTRESGLGRPMMGVTVAWGNVNVDLIFSTDMMEPSRSTARRAGGQMEEIAKQLRVAEPCETTAAKKSKCNSAYVIKSRQYDELH